MRRSRRIPYSRTCVDSDGENTDGDVSLDEIKDDDYIPAYKTRVNNWGKDPRPEYNTFSVKTSFNQSLMDQTRLPEPDKPGSTTSRRS